MKALPIRDLESIHRMIVDGRGADARPVLMSWKTHGVSRELAARFAWLCWRSGVPELGLDVLGPCLRESHRVLNVATSAERSEQAQCLIRAGAPAEALTLLRDIDPTEYPRAHFYAAAAKISRWEYDAALPLLEAYLATTKAGTYDRLVAQVNLAAALVHEEGGMAKLALRRIALEASLRKAPVLYANTLEIEAQLCLRDRRFEEALSHVRHAAEILSRSGMNDYWYTRKWEAIARLRGAATDDEARASYETARAEAFEHKSWESLRQLDRELALRFRDVATFQKVFFGSPYPAYRRGLERVWSEGGISEGAWEYSMGAKVSKKTPMLDLSEGSFGDERLRPGKVLHRLLFSIASDHYRPQTTASLFGVIFPGEVYHPEFGKKRVHQSLFLLRRWLEESGVPASVEERNGFYHLEGAPACRFRVPAWSPWEPKPWRDEVARDSLKRGAGDREFSSGEAAAILGSSARTTLRILGEGIKLGWLVRRGNRNGARYRILAAGERSEGR